MTSKEEFKIWKKQSEKASEQKGFPIKIINKKWNNLKTFLASMGIILLALFFLGIYVVRADMVVPQIENSTITFKVIHEITISPELRDYIENKTPEIWNAIKQEFGK